MEYDVDSIELVKTQKTKYVIQTSEHIFQIWVDYIVHNHIFLKIIFSLCSDKFREMFISFVALHLLSSSVFVRRPHRCVYFQILYDTMNFYVWKLNLSWSYKGIICKRITEPSCWTLTCY